MKEQCDFRGQVKFFFEAVFMPTYFLFRSLTSCAPVFEITDHVKPSEEAAGVKHMDGTVSLRASLLMLSRPLNGSKPGPFFLESSGGRTSWTDLIPFREPSLPSLLSHSCSLVLQTVKVS